MGLGARINLMLVKNIPPQPGIEPDRSVRSQPLSIPSNLGPLVILLSFWISKNAKKK
jgi:hypothetical protein